MSEAATGSDSDAECPTCGRTDFASVKGMKNHHAKSHGESISGVVVSCTQCGDEKRVRQSDASKCEHHFCSDECQHEWRSEHLSGENHPRWKRDVTVQCAQCGEEKDVNPCMTERRDNHFCDQECRAEWLSEHSTGDNNPSWQGGDVTVQCAQCGEEKEVQQSRAAHQKQFFCDHDCQGEWCSEHQTGENHPTWMRETVACAYCGDEKTIKRDVYLQTDRQFCGADCHAAWQSENKTGENAPAWEGGGVSVNCANCGEGIRVASYRHSAHERFFCGHTCAGEWRSEHLSGENHPNWAGGYDPYYGTGWTEEKRETVRDSQDRECAGCGIHEDELAQRLDVHHIVKARTFDNPEKRNAVENLVGLCRSCHREWEQMSPLRPEFAD